MPTSITARPILARTKGELRQLRQSGWVPASIQHRGEETIHLQVERKLVDEFIRKHGVSAILEPMVESEGRRVTVQIHDIQRDPVTGQVLQLSFQKLLRGEKMKAHVPIRLLGTPAPVEEGIGVVQQPIDHVDVECEPQNQPGHIDVDISGLDFHTVIRVSDLPHSDKYRILTSEDTVVASVTTLAARDVHAEEEEAAEAPPAAEGGEAEQLEPAA
jgi:large subunit ribosomal protein L25